MLYVCRWYTQLVCGLLRNEACGGCSRGADCPHCRSWPAQGVRWLVRRILVNATKLLMCLSPPPRRPLVPSGGLWQLWAAERHLWLILSDIKDRDRVFLLDAVVAFWPFRVMLLTPSWTGTRRQAAAIQWFLPRRSPAQGAVHGLCRVLAPHMGMLRKRASPPVLPHKQIGTGAVRRRALGRGPRSLSKICGPFFRWRVLWPRSTEAGGPGLMRVAPAGKERRSPQRTVSVSPQCLQEIDLLTCNVRCSRAQQSPAAHISVSSHPELAELSMLATPSGVSGAS